MARGAHHGAQRLRQQPLRPRHILRSHHRVLRTHHRVLRTRHRVLRTASVSPATASSAPTTASSAPTTASSAPAAASSGRALFAQACGACHTLSGHNDARHQGGDLLAFRASRVQFVQLASEMPVRRPLSRGQLQAVVRFVRAVEARHS